MRKFLILVLATFIVGGLLIYFGEAIESQFLYATSNEGFLAARESEKETAEVVEKAEVIEKAEVVEVTETKETAVKSGQVKAKSSKENNRQNEAEKPKITIPAGVTEIPFSEGDLKVERRGRDVVYIFNGREFAKGTINPDGTYYISHHYKTEKAQWTRAFSTARVNLHRLSEGREMKPNILEEF